MNDDSNGWIQIAYFSDTLLYTVSNAFAGYPKKWTVSKHIHLTEHFSLPLQTRVFR